MSKNNATQDAKRHSKERKLQWRNNKYFEKIMM